MKTESYKLANRFNSSIMCTDNRQGLTLLLWLCARCWCAMDGELHFQYASLRCQGGKLTIGRRPDFLFKYLFLNNNLGDAE